VQKETADTAGGARESIRRRPSATVFLFSTNSPHQILIITVATLIALSIVMLFSLNAPLNEMSLSTKFLRHILFVGVAVAVAFLSYLIGPQKLLDWYKVLLGICVLLLVLVFIPPLGGKIRGAARWLSFGSFHFQPSEFAKLVCALLIARIAGENEKSLLSFREFFIKALLPVGLLVFLVLIEPDFGSAVFLAVMSATLFFISGISIRYIALSLLLSIVLILPIAVVKFDHVRSRVEEFLSDEGDYLGRGYQPYQSLIALGSGGATGRGLGASRQKLMFLPDRDTDFILAIIGEEMGFCGTVSVLLLFIVYFLCGLQIALKTKNTSLRILAFSSCIIPTAQGLLNIAVVSASLPTKGIALPFVSFGGSALLINFVWVAILLSMEKLNERSTRCEK